MKKGGKKTTESNGDDDVDDNEFDPSKMNAMLKTAGNAMCYTKSTTPPFSHTKGLNTHKYIF